MKGRFLTCSFSPKFAFPVHLLPKFMYDISMFMYSLFKVHERHFVGKLCMSDMNQIKLTRELLACKLNTNFIKHVQ